MTKDDLIVSYWAIGPSYRRELKENLRQQPLNQEWFNIIILTDYTADFAEFEGNKNIKAILDLAEQRKAYEWSFETEPLPQATADEEVYSTEFNELRKFNRNFSYSLHRFSLPWVANNGFSKCILLDADVYFRVPEDVTKTEEFMDGFIKVNFDNIPSESKVKLLPGRIIEKTFGTLEEFFGTLSELVQERFPDTYTPTEFTDLEIGDGPIKLYKFDTPEQLQQYFNVWNFVTEQVMGQHRRFLSENAMVGPYVINDEVTVALINKFTNVHAIYGAVHGMKILHNVYKTRYFALLHGPYTAARSLEEFLEINNITLNDIDPLAPHPHAKDL